MRLLVAGGAGYVGSALIPRLLESGYMVDVVDLFWFGNNLPAETGLLSKDLFDVTVEDLQDYDQVIFLAGLSNDPMAEFSPSKNFVYNAAAPAYLAYMAKKAGVKRYVYASSCSVYGYTVNELYDETRPVASSYPYGISKLQGEQAVMNLMDERFSVIALRKGTISGYSPRMRLDLIVNTMFRTALRREGSSRLTTRRSGGRSWRWRTRSARISERLKRTRAFRGFSISRRETIRWARWAISSRAEIEQQLGSED